MKRGGFGRTVFNVMGGRLILGAAFHNFWGGVSFYSASFLASFKIDFKGIGGLFHL